MACHYGGIDCSGDVVRIVVHPLRVSGERTELMGGHLELRWLRVRVTVG